MHDFAHSKNQPFEGRLAVSLCEAAAAVFGWSSSTTRTYLARGKFPLPMIQIGGKKLVRVSELLDLIENQPLVSEIKKRKPGRPTKREQIERAAKEGVK